ncbi:MAG: aminoglycoside phosphotransferase family protein [Anaerolineaceae bacterium]|nr:aminoglycoside phosphotransferase family protein [Anaerolineaceae bacterium]
MELGKVIARGRTAEVYNLSENQVLKLFYEWVSRESVELEFMNNNLAQSAGLPVPQIFGMSELYNRLGIIYEKVTGETMLHRLISKPWQVIELSQQLAELQSAIHQVPGEGLLYFREQWQKNILHSGKLTSEQKEKILAHVSQIPASHQLCHFDFHPDQVVYTSHGPVILDWMTASNGDPEADVARTQLMLTIGTPPDANWFLRLLSYFLGRFACHHYRKRYLELNPVIQSETIDAWMAPMASARLRENIEFEEPKLMRIIYKLLSD